MEMESSPEEVAVSYSSSSGTGGDGQQYATTGFAKRKRTKRLRAFPSPPPLPPSNPHVEEEDYFSTTTTTTEEEEDMANCLILLAQGRMSPREEKFTSRKFTETITTAGAKAGFYVYECKTCNKCFPSFQALGGHRASHKKPKLAAANTTLETAATTIKNNNSNHDGLEISMNSFANKSSSCLVPAAASPAANSRLRVHECSICGSEFASGQALGGHMRRHRPVGPAAVAPTSPEAAAAAAATTINKEKKGSMLSLDLNLPAPSEENNDTSPMATVAFAFADQRPMALVDCHY